MAEAGHGLEAFRTAVTELRALQADIFRTMARTEDGWRTEVISLRRRFQEKMSTLVEMVSRKDADWADAQTLAAIREALNRVRSKVALHQATWPAVAIDRANPEYQSSLQELGAVAGKLDTLLNRFLDGR